MRMSRRGLLGWSAVIGTPLAYIFGSDEQEQLDEIKEANRRPLREQLDDVTSRLDQEPLPFAVIPDSAYAFDETEEGLAVSYEGRAEGDPATVTMAADTHDTEWGAILEAVQEEQYETREATMGVETIYGRDIDAFEDAEDFIETVYDDEGLMEDAVITSASLVATAMEATMADELKFYEDSDRADNTGIWADLNGVEPDPDRSVTAYRSRVEGIEIDDTVYTVEHDIEPDAYADAIDAYSFQGKLDGHLRQYRDTATVTEQV